MSELFPQIVIRAISGSDPTSLTPDYVRICADVRPYQGVYNSQQAQGSGPAAKVQHRLFANGSVVDLSQSSSATAYTVVSTSGTFTVYGVMLEMVTSKSAVCNGASFGGQFPAVLGLGTTTPGALANGLTLTVVSAGVSTLITTLKVNGDFCLGQYPIAGGSLTGGVYTFRAKYELHQPLVSGTTDAITWMVNDNMTGRGISELRAIAYGATV